MEGNMGMADRIIRVTAAIGIVALIIAGTTSGPLAIIVGTLALVLALTGILGFCPLYLAFRISTRRRELPRT
jgi:hypothetical protein